MLHIVIVLAWLIALGLAVYLANKLLREIIPDLRRLAIVGNASNPNALMEMAEVQATARSLGFIEVITPKIRRAEDISPPLLRRSRATRRHSI
jgi:ABC-type uncharacterized transport system substrate-binding protein